MNNSFPKLPEAKIIGESGINLVSSIVNNELKWIFRKNHDEYDFGIDGYIDIVTNDGNVTGQSIAVQVKAGNSFLKHKSNNGFTFYGETKHLNYYRNSQIPILIIICDPDTRNCWYVVFDEYKTEPTTKNWKINIPKSNIFGIESKETIINILPPLKDDIEEIKIHWTQNKILEDAGLIFYAIEKHDIQSINTKPFVDFINRLSINDNLCIKIQGKLEIVIDGYNDSLKELFEIKEVIRWIKKVEKEEIPWFYYCNAGKKSYWLYAYIHSMIGTTVKKESKRYTKTEIINYHKNKDDLPLLKINFDMKDFVNMVNINWLRLNKMTEKLGMSIQENALISYDVSKLLFHFDDKTLNGIFGFNK